MPIRAVTYSRNSCAEQVSIDSQDAATARTCAELGAEIVAQLSDPSSASRYATRIRRNWIRLLELVPDVDLIVMWEPSRGDRTLGTWISFIDLCRSMGVKIHAVSHRRTYDPRVARDYRSLAEDGVDSAYESDKISARTLRGIATAMEAGRPHGSLPYGYRRTYDSRGRLVQAAIDDRDPVVQTADPEIAPVVRDIYTSVAGGESLRSLCVRLTRAGTAPPRGGRIWYGATITRIIRNEAYRPHPANPARGRRTHDGEVLDTPGAWPPLVSEAVWRAANQVLGAHDEAARKARRDSAPGAIRYLLSGSTRVMTAPCGSQLSGWTHHVGRSSHYACRHDRCVSAPMPDVDEYVTRLVVARLSAPDVRDLWAVDDAASEAAADELAALSAELAEARASWLAPGGISAADWVAKQGTMRPAIEDAQRRARPAGVPLVALQLISAARMGADTVRPTWDALALVARRELISAMFCRLTLGPAAVRVTRRTPADERIAIAAARVSHEWRRAAG